MPANRLGGFLPAGVHAYAQQFKYMRFNYDGKISKENLLHYNKTIIDRDKDEFVDFLNTALYAPTAYPLQTLTCWLSSKLDLKPSTTLYLMRISSLLTWLLAFLMAVQWMPKNKLLLVFIATLPAILVLHCSVTADVISNALALVLVALTIKWRNQDHPVSRSQLLLFATLILVLSVNKIVYLPLILLWFLVPSHTFAVRRHFYLYFLLIAAASVIATGLWSHKANQSYITYEEYHPDFRDDQQIKPGGDPMEQTKYVLSHPVTFTKNMIRSYLSIVPSSAAHLTGKFGWEKNYLPAWIIGLMWITILALMMQGTLDFTTRDRIIMGCSILGCLVLFAVVMYGIYSPVGNDYIHNLGGKYLIPIFPVMILALSGRLVEVKNLELWSKMILIVAHVIMISAIIQRYYF